MSSKTVNKRRTTVPAAKAAKKKSAKKAPTRSGNTIKRTAGQLLGSPRTFNKVVFISVAVLIAAAGSYLLIQSRAITAQSWRDDFNGTAVDTNRWLISNGRAPGTIDNNHIGYFEPGRAKVQNGYLVLDLYQERGQVGTNTNGVISRGGELESIGTYGYGTYEFRARMSSTSNTPGGTGSTVSGTISGLFNYINNSQTEIDFEKEGQYEKNIYMTNWVNPDPKTGPTWPDDRTSTTTQLDGTSADFRTYKFVWTSDKVEYYIDGVHKASHTTHVPSAPAKFMLNHWGTNNQWWGGLATVGTARYLYVDWVSYTAPDESSVSVPDTTTPPSATTADILAPVVAVTSPGNGSAIGHKVRINATASDNVGTTKMEIYINGTRRSSSSTGAISYNWNTRREAKGTYTITVKAYDAAGNAGQSSITVYK